MQNEQHLRSWETLTFNLFLAHAMPVLRLNMYQLPAKTVSSTPHLIKNEKAPITMKYWKTVAPLSWTRGKTALKTKRRQQRGILLAGALASIGEKSLRAKLGSSSGLLGRL